MVTAFFFPEYPDFFIEVVFFKKQGENKRRISEATTLFHHSKIVSPLFIYFDL